MTLPENHLGHADAVRRWPRWPSTSPQSTSAAGSAPPPPPPPTSRDPMWRTTPTTPCRTRPQSGGMGAEVFFLGWWCLVGYLMGINGSSSPYFPFFVGYHSGSFSPFFFRVLTGSKKEVKLCCTRMLHHQLKAVTILSGCDLLEYFAPQWHPNPSHCRCIMTHSSCHKH